jgi:chemotaxis signal transduction protein
MAIFSPLRLRRLTDQVAEATQQFITFQIGQKFCAVPIDQLIKVILTETNDEEQLSNSSRPVISYKDQELAIWDAGQVLFGQTSLTRTKTQNQHMLLGRAANDQVVVLAIDSPPATQTVKSSAIQPVHDLPGIMATITTDCQYYVVNLAAIENL